MQYRKDIDGLRALAVVPVVLFHGQVPGFTGGFVGVDVFFVISGYLITGLISGEIERKEFSYINFWERRARRLMPALIWVALVTSIAAYFLLLPHEFKRLGESLVALAGFASNIYFWMKAGYFGAPSEVIPLLHTWSLAVEEQFYVVFPAVLLLLAGFSGKAHKAAIAGIGVSSFAISVWLAENDANTAYYMLHSRAWELMLGAYLVYARPCPTLGPRLLGALWIAAVAMILVPVFTYHEGTPFPGMAALWPCAGTAILIYSGGQAHALSRLVFENEPTVWVGKLSYSWYLWHWPVLVLGAAWDSKFISALSGMQVAVLIVLSFLLAWFSLKVVEEPIRRRKLLASRNTIFAGVGATLALLVVVGFASYMRDGFESRLPEHVRVIASGEQDLDDTCNQLSSTVEALQAGEFCQVGVGDDSEPQFVLLGDSHAAALLRTAHRAAEELGVNALVIARGACPPIGEVAIPTQKWAQGCAEFNREVMKYLEENPVPSTVLAGYWGAYVTLQDTFMLGEGAPPEDAGSEAHVVAALDRTVQQFRATGTQLVMVEEVPYPDQFYHPSRAAVAAWRGQDVDTGITLSEHAERVGWFRSQTERLQLPTVVPAEVMCGDDAFCPAIADGRSNYRDNHHVSAHAAGELAPLLVDALRESGVGSG